MENRLEKELGRLCREYAACSVEVERRDEARKVKSKTETGYFRSGIAYSIAGCL